MSVCLREIIAYPEHLEHFMVLLSKFMASYHKLGYTFNLQTLAF